MLLFSLLIYTIFPTLVAMKRPLDKAFEWEEKNTSEKKLSCKKLALMKYSNPSNWLALLPLELQNELGKYLIFDHPSPDHYLFAEQKSYNAHKFPEKVTQLTQVHNDTTIHPMVVESDNLVFNKNASLFASISEQGIEIFDIKTGIKKSTIKTEPEDVADLYEIWFNDSYHYLNGIFEIGLDGNKKIKVWDVLKGTCLFEYDFLPNWNMCYAADRMVITDASCKGLVKIFDMHNSALQILDSKIPKIKCIAGGYQDKILAVAGNKILKIFNLITLECINTLKISAKVCCCDFSPDGQLLYLWQDQQSGYFNLNVKKFLSLPSNIIFKWSPDSKKFATSKIPFFEGESCLKIWESENRKQEKTFIDPTNGLKDWYWSPDSKRILYVGQVSNEEEILKVWDTKTNFIRTIKKIPLDEYNGIVWSGDGRKIHLFSDSKITTISLYKKKLKKELEKIPLWSAQLLIDIYEKEKKKEPIAPLIALHQQNFQALPERIKTYLQTKQ